MSTRHPFRWPIFGAMAGVYFGFGAMVASIPPMIDVVRGDLGISRSAMGFALGAWAFIYIGSAPVAGRVIDRIGLRWSLGLGAASIAASGVARAAAQGLGTLWLAIAIFGLGGPLVSAAAPKLVATWFGDEQERRLAVGVYTAAPALGGMLSLLITNSVLLPWLGDWRTVVLAYSALAAASGAAWVLVSSAAPAPPAQAIGSGSAVGGDWRRLLESPGVRLALGLGIGTFFVNHGLAAWLPSALENQAEISAGAASAWVGVSFGVGIVVSLVVPRHADGALVGKALTATMLVMAAASIAVAFGPPALAVIGVLAIGVRALLIPLVIIVLMSADGVGPSNMGMANGLWFSFVEIGGTTGPLVLGSVADTTAGFRGSMLVVAALLVLMSVPSLRASDQPDRATTEVLSS